MGYDTHGPSSCPGFEDDRHGPSKAPNLTVAAQPHGPVRHRQRNPRGTSLRGHEVSRAVQHQRGVCRLLSMATSAAAVLLLPGGRVPAAVRSSLRAVVEYQLSKESNRVLSPFCFFQLVESRPPHVVARWTARRRRGATRVVRACFNPLGDERILREAMKVNFLGVYVVPFFLYVWFQPPRFLLGDSVIHCAEDGIRQQISSNCVECKIGVQSDPYTLLIGTCSLGSSIKRRCRSLCNSSNINCFDVPYCREALKLIYEVNS